MEKAIVHPAVLPGIFKIGNEHIYVCPAGRIFRFQFDESLDKLDCEPGIVGRVTECEPVPALHEIIVSPVCGSLGLIEIRNVPGSLVKPEPGRNHSTAAVCPLGGIDHAVSPFAVPIDIVGRIAKIVIKPCVEGSGEIQDAGFLGLWTYLVIAHQEPGGKAVCSNCRFRARSYSSHSTRVPGP